MQHMPRHFSWRRDSQAGAERRRLVRALASAWVAPLQSIERASASMAPALPMPARRAVRDDYCR